MKKGEVIIIGLLFGLSRIYVLAYPPYYPVEVNGRVEYRGYSDVKHDSERYANMWYYGLMPYREHLFEYPPGAIPLMLIPLIVDQAGLGHYYPNYRVQIFILETILFAGIVYTVYHLPIKRKQQRLALGFYILAGALAKDFWYDGLDLVFIGSLTLAFIWRWSHNYNQGKHRVVFWAFFWLSVAVKMLTGPLLVPYFFLRRHQWRQEIMALSLGAMVIWLIPLVLFRSSLSVFLFFHQYRPLKYEAFGTWIVLAVNDWTQTETQTQIAPHFPMAGPATRVVEQSLLVVFPLSILMVLGWSLYQLRQQSGYEPQDRLTVLHYLIKYTLVYMFTIFLTSKIFSRPFHLWYVPLITIYPFKQVKTQLIFMGWALLLLALDTTPYLTVPPLMLGLVPLQRIRDVWRFIPLLMMLVMAIRLPRPAPSRG
ncbi:hypothetical protein A2W24_00860 [Microgenomates group bacterium RBG_16_45_19]|nr:MAG: hypothetical protein A2W24_00860 [Microgenomates group bacterium RBG_16_45_19]